MYVYPHTRILSARRHTVPFTVTEYRVRDKICDASTRASVRAVHDATHARRGPRETNRRKRAARANGRWLRVITLRRREFATRARSDFYPAPQRGTRLPLGDPALGARFTMQSPPRQLQRQRHAPPTTQRYISPLALHCHVVVVRSARVPGGSRGTGPGPLRSSTVPAADWSTVCDRGAPLVLQHPAAHVRGHTTLPPERVLHGYSQSLAATAAVRTDIRPCQSPAFDVGPLRDVFILTFQ